MKICCISDMHGFHQKMKPLPKADILLVCGDFTRIGRIEEITSFNYWLEQQKHKFSSILICAGNHDLLFEQEPSFARSLLNRDFIYLQDEEIIIDGIKFYASPYTSRFRDWAFQLDRMSEETKIHWNKIPDDVSVLITHGPPFRILDQTEDGCFGCELLMERVRNLQNLKLHVFGHLHGSYGVYPEDNPIFVNCSICDEKYNPVNLPIVIDIK